MRLTLTFVLGAGIVTAICKMICGICKSRSEVDRATKSLNICTNQKMCAQREQIACIKLQRKYFLKAKMYKIVQHCITNENIKAYVENLQGRRPQHLLREWLKCLD